MGRYDQAPKLINKNKPKSKGNFMQMGMEVFKSINEKIDARHAVARSLLILLIGTADGFGLSQKFILENLGCSEKRYYTARQYLESLGLITVNKEENIITINYNVLMDRHEVLPENKMGGHEDNPDRLHVYPKSGHEVYSKDRHEVSYNIEETNNKTENITKPAALNKVELAVPEGLSEEEKKKAVNISKKVLMGYPKSAYRHIEDNYYRSLKTNVLFKLLS